MKSQIKDIRLAQAGANQIRWARAHMPALLEVEKRFAREKPFKNLRIGMALHVTKETGVLVETLEAGGATVSIASCNPLSTQDDVAAYLAKKGTKVFAYKGESNKDYYKFIKAVIADKPHITIDDGCDLVTEIHLKNADLIPQIIGGCEETTTGINRLKAMEADKAIRYPIVAVNDNKTKHLFDNYYGTGQSTWDGILRATNILLAGKTVVVAGYGDCGRGIAERARGHDAHVIVTEIDPVRALQATMDGYEVMKMDAASTLGDVFVTATGNKHVINTAHMKKMKSGAIMANAGHFNTEIDIGGLAKLAKLARGKKAGKKLIRPFTEEFTLNAGHGHGAGKARGKQLYLLAEGRLVNLSAAEGHPSEVMSLSFCGQALACEWLVKNSRRNANNSRTTKLEPRIYTLPKEIDDEIATLELKTHGIAIDKLTKDQLCYAQSWREGT